jgi:hypothetical protein
MAETWIAFKQIQREIGMVTLKYEKEREHQVNVNRVQAPDSKIKGSRPTLHNVRTKRFNTMSVAMLTHYTIR